MFTQKKFLGLERKAQHKKLSELIKRMYYQKEPALFKEIQLLESYMDLLWTPKNDDYSLSDSFHKHLQAAGLGISEHALLIREYDRESPLKNWLDVVIYLDHIRSAENIGSIIRTIEAFRLGKICFSKDMANLDHPKVQKTSMGAYQHVEEVHEMKLKPLIAVETHQKAIPLNEFTFPPSFTLALGNEEFGLSSSIVEQADYIVEVPLCGRKNSLNVAACMGILAYKIDHDLRNCNEKIVCS